MADDVDLIERSLSSAAAQEFEQRVADQADRLKTAIADGEFDNDDFTVGLEMEVYAVEAATAPGDGTGRLARLPSGVFESGATKELGLHNAEINTDPSEFSASGLERQHEAIRRGVASARQAARAHDRDLVLDAMWTIPPGTGSETYLRAREVADDHLVAVNMRPDPRYRAIDQAVRSLGGDELPLRVPGADHCFPSILFESLATSIQPHLQVPRAAALPYYYNAAIRTLGPLVALAANSPFLPADLYNDVDDPAHLVDATHHELRVAVFEQSVNHSPSPKVRVPRDIDAATDVVDRVVADDRYAPFLREWLENGERRTLADEIWEFDHKRSTYWRWVRCVLGGDPVQGACGDHSLRLEYRPLATQPTVADVVGLQALTAGLLHGLAVTEHPLPSLPWDVAESSFYAAARDGLDADLAWVTADGERTNETGEIYPEIFDLAATGLAECGLSSTEVDTYLDPLRRRVDAGVTPSTWKKARVREGLAAGMDLEDAIRNMQHTYIRQAAATGSFADWL